jgi:hypothetical protein
MNSPSKPRDEKVLVVTRYTYKHPGTRKQSSLVTLYKWLPGSRSDGEQTTLASR